VAGAALGGFSVGLLGLYAKTPGMHPSGSLRPTDDGIPLAKNVWLLGVASSLVLGALRAKRRSAGA
jgi:hypothetical protein